LLTWKFHSEGNPPAARSKQHLPLAVKPVAGDGWLAIGDAAMSFDPLSGPGMLKAISAELRRPRQ
jgi:flavin-dependent dehydrogenase